MCLTVFLVPPPSLAAPVLPRADHDPAPRSSATLLGVPLRLYARALVVAFVAALAAVLPSSAPPATASSTYLCSGYSGCRSAGYSDGGYGARNGQMYWRMYAGHNCTNYVAYRLIQAGMSTERPWSSTGMAYNWGRVNPDITDKVPAVGAVAWWESNVSGTGSSGHVAIVERVISDREIVISEDSWSGDFHWRTIRNDGSHWPTGFIHFVDAEKTLENTRRATVENQARVGSPLRATLSRWSPGGVSHELQWFRGRNPIAGATEQRYVPTAADLRKVISVRDQVSRDGFTTANSRSTSTAKVVAGEFERVAPPEISGELEAGQTLTATSARFSPQPSAQTFSWKVGGEVVAGATRPTLKLTRAMAGKRVEVVVRATKPGYEQIFGGRGPVGPVIAGRIEVPEPFQAAGTNRYGEQLTFTPGAITPADAKLTYRWLRDGEVIPGADGTAYAPTTEDVGHAISVRATMTKPTWARAVRTADYLTTTTDSTVRLRGSGREHRAVVRASLAAPGWVPTGWVRAEVGPHAVTGQLIDGVYRFVLPYLRAGQKKVVVTYGGDGVAEAGRAVLRVRVTK